VLESSDCEAVVVPRNGKSYIPVCKVYVEAAGLEAATNSRVSCMSALMAPNRRGTLIALTSMGQRYG
jgi:hypothetical protein